MKLIWFAYKTYEGSGKSWTDSYLDLYYQLGDQCKDEHVTHPFVRLTWSTRMQMFIQKLSVTFTILLIILELFPLLVFCGLVWNVHNGAVFLCVLQK